MPLGISQEISAKFPIKILQYFLEISQGIRLGILYIEILSVIPPGIPPRIHLKNP